MLKMMRVRQEFPKSPPLDILATLRREFKPDVKRGASIAVAAGSRGISNYGAIVGAVVTLLKEAGAKPFIVPAMGSHGGATPEGQRSLLAEYGITEEKMGVPIRDSMATERLGTTAEGIPVNFSAEALRADGVVVVNRVKPHTDFIGKVGSGLLKMIAIGLGKQAGAAACHAAGQKFGLERVIKNVAGLSLKEAPILGGVAILEDPYHETARLAFVPRLEIEVREVELQVEARKLMPRLPFDEMDLLIIDRIGKNISGPGMDPNVVGRPVQGYSATLSDRSWNPVVRRILVTDLTAESHGNAIGVGMADFTTAKLVGKIDKKAMYMNALTSLSVATVKIPITFDTDRDAVEGALGTLALDDPSKARVIRIQDTLSLGTVQVSEAFAEAVKGRKELTVLGAPAEIAFDAAGNLLPL
jgi:hypothetical protein